VALPIAPVLPLLALGAGLLIGSRAVTAVRRGHRAGGARGEHRAAGPRIDHSAAGAPALSRVVVGSELGPASESGTHQRAAGLRVGVLGPLTINARSGGLLPAQSQLLVALALNGRAGTANRKLCRLLGADPDHPRPSDSLRQLIVRTRRQLGRAPDGAEWIEHLGGGKYALHPAARLDWHEFGELAARGLGTSDSAPLAQAMRLVRGQPLADCWYWWLDLGLAEAMRARIVDVATALADLALAGHDHAAAARAARAGLLADPAAERLWRLLMRAEHAAGNPAGVREAWAQCLAAIADIAADGQPEQATCSLRRELMGNGGN
jgi:DNA-binding SARP family transcriptional activator